MDDFGILPIEELVSLKTDYDTLCGVYFLFSGSTLAYIGSSANCLVRFREHKRDGKEFDSYFILETTKAKMLALEAQYIARYNPPLNKILW